MKRKKGEIWPGKERLTGNAKAAWVLGLIQAFSDTEESEGRQTKQCWITFVKNPKNPPLKMKKENKVEYDDVKWD